MKNAIAIIIALAATPAAANMCAALEGMGEQIMADQLGGFPISEMIGEIDESSTGLAADAAKALVIATYGKAAYDSEIEQQRAIKEIANGAYLACIGGLSK